MAGTESTNEKRAAVSRFSPRNSPAMMVMPLREVPGMMESACAHPMAMPSAQVTLSMDLSPMRRRSAIQISTPTTISIAPIRYGTAPGALHLLVEQVSEDADRHRSDREQPQQLRIQLELRIVADLESEALPDDLNPIAEEVGQRRDQRAGVQRDVEHQPRIFPSEQPRHQDQMRRAADGKEFGERLDDRENNGLVEWHETAILPSRGRQLTWSLLWQWLP